MINLKEFTIYNQTLAENLKCYRVANNDSIEIIAKVLSVRPSTVKAWEDGKKIPPLNAVIELAQLYKVPIDCLINFSKFGRTITTLEPLKDGEMTVAEKELIFKYRQLDEELQHFLSFIAKYGFTESIENTEEFRKHRDRLEAMLKIKGIRNKNKKNI